MYFQPSLTASPTRSTDPLAIPVKKGEIIGVAVLAASEGECLFEGEKFQKLFKFFYFLFYVIFVYVLDNR